MCVDTRAGGMVAVRGGQAGAVRKRAPAQGTARWPRASRRWARAPVALSPARAPSGAPGSPRPSAGRFIRPLLVGLERHPRVHVVPVPPAHQGGSASSRPPNVRTRVTCRPGRGPVEVEDVEVKVQPQRRAEPLRHRHRSAPASGAVVVHQPGEPVRRTRSAAERDGGPDRIPCAGRPRSAPTHPGGQARPLGTR